jgi:DNA-binding NarL/FixJ family response regulator
VPIRVCLVEDHRMMREALCEVLKKETDIHVVGESGTAREALQQAKALAPDVIVLDIRLPDVNGIEVAARLRDSANPPKVVALSGFADRRFVTAMIHSGASAYVAKSAAGTELVRAIRAVAAGQAYFSPEIASILLSELSGRSVSAEQAPLARREREVIRLVAEGRRSAAIAVQLHISVATVEVHRRNIMRKLGLRSIAELARYAVREGIIAQ